MRPAAGSLTAGAAGAALTLGSQGGSSSPPMLPIVPVQAARPPSSANPSDSDRAAGTTGRGYREPGESETNFLVT
jgi:hypothetical protein